MKKLKLFVYALIVWFSIGTVAAQLPYSWTAGDPGWTSSNPSNNTLGWQSYGAVSTSNMNGASWYSYNNSQITQYTSPVYNFTGCNTASVVTVTINLSVNLENRYDWLYFQYTINGTTWINPVALSPVVNNSNVNLSGFPPLTTWTNNNSNRNGWTGVVTGNQTFLIPKTVTQFRFIFASDNSVNTYGPPGNPNIYYADINSFSVQCLGVLPVELVSFDGIFNKENTSNDLIWITESERDNDYFTIERRANDLDGTWVNIATINGAGNSIVTSNYLFQDTEYTHNVINYYRISQTDYDGKKEVFDDMIIAIDNRDKYKKIIKIVNILGQEVKSDTPGVVIYIYEDNTIKRFVNM